MRHTCAYIISNISAPSTPSSNSRLERPPLSRMTSTTSTTSTGSNSSRHILTQDMRSDRERFFSSTANFGMLGRNMSCEIDRHPSIPCHVMPSHSISSNLIP